MEGVVGLLIYVSIGIIGRKVLGYKGIVETLLWPLAIVCALYLKKTEEDE